jgi:hypothetical protein
LQGRRTRRKRAPLAARIPGCLEAGRHAEPADLATKCDGLGSRLLAGGKPCSGRAIIAERVRTSEDKCVGW